jgi:ArsR family transcriptional regulator
MYSELQVFKAEFFRALAHPIRIRILEVLRGVERSVQEIQELVQIGQPIASQQLAILRAKGIVVARKQGTTVRYSLRDPRVSVLLDTAREIFNHHLISAREMLRELKKEAR